jgi:hypothetical protein
MTKSKKARWVSQEVSIKETRNSCIILVRKSEGMVDEGVDGSILLKGILKEQGVGMWKALIWSRIPTSGGLFSTWQ